MTSSAGFKLNSFFRAIGLTYVTYAVAFGRGHASVNEHGPLLSAAKMWPVNRDFTAYEVCTNFRRDLLQRGRRTGVEPLNLVIIHIMQHHL